MPTHFAFRFAYLTHAGFIALLLVLSSSFVIGQGPTLLVSKKKISKTAIASPPQSVSGALAEDPGMEAFFPEAIEYDTLSRGTKLPQVSTSNDLSEQPLEPLTRFSIYETPKASFGMLRNETESAWKKTGRASFLIGGIELAGMGILMCMPKEVTKWEDDWTKDAMRNMKRAFTTAPVWDKDEWAINYIGHPVAGSYYYNAMRSQKATWFQSFLFATAQSCIWEYVIEGAAEIPSAQDLITTPIGGAILGEPIHQLTMTMRRNGFSFFEKVFVVVFNPMFVMNNGFGPRHNPVRHP